MIKGFKPMLIPNSKEDDGNSLRSLKELGVDPRDYYFFLKKDGCRVELIDGDVLGRSLKQVPSNYYNDKYKDLAQYLRQHGVVLEGELFSPNMSFREICRFYKTTNVIYNRKDLEKSKTFDKDWNGRTIDWMSTYHDDLKLYVFDCYVQSRPELSIWERLDYLKILLTNSGFNGILEFPQKLELLGLQDKTYDEIYDIMEETFEEVLSKGYEGIVLVNKTKPYRFGRATLKEKCIYKIKEDALEYDGQIINVTEGTRAKEGAPKSTNELGRSVTSKLQEDREPSGIASGFDVMYNGYRNNVSLQGFNHNELRQILIDKDKYIGTWIKYKGMKPTKNVPRHSRFLEFRDDK